MKKQNIYLLTAVISMCITQFELKGNEMKNKLNFNDSMELLLKENKYLKKEVDKINSNIQQIRNLLDSQKITNDELNSTLKQTTDRIDKQINDTKNNSDYKILNLGKSLSKSSLYGIIGVISAIALSGLLYWLLSLRQKIDKNQLSNIINNTKNELTQESAKLDLQLLEVIEKQLKVADKLNATEPKIDHTFHKNSANELQRIANYANSLDPESQEAVALQGSLGRLRNYFNSSDYEITDFTGKEYDERIPMRVRDTKYDESLPFGKEIIAKTWEPQIKYKGLVIQEAKIDKKYNN